MANAPITPNVPNVDEHIVTIWANSTSGGATTRNTVTLPTYAPKIDLRVGHPVLNMIFISNEAAGAVSDREIHTMAQEMARGTAADSTSEWEVVDASTVAIYNTADKDGILGITYMAFGSQEA